MAPPHVPDAVPDATAAYRADRDLIAVQQLLGHSSVATTQRYTALPDDALRRAVLGAVA